MKVIDADLKTLAKIKHAGQEYELREVSLDEMMEVQKMEDTSEALYVVLEKSGVPKDVSKKFSVSTLKQLEKLIIGELAEKK